MSAPKMDWVHTLWFTATWLGWIAALCLAVLLAPMPWTLVPIGLGLTSMLGLLAATSVWWGRAEKQWAMDH
jgi:hypothetical protein